MQDLIKLLDNVHDEQTFILFVEALLIDRKEAAENESNSPSSPYSPDWGGWENIRIDTFLEAALAWAKDSKFGRNRGLSEKNPWKMFASFLYCGKIYE